MHEVVQKNWPAVEMSSDECRPSAGQRLAEDDVAPPPPPLGRRLSRVLDREQERQQQDRSRRSPSRRSTARCPWPPPSAAPWVSSDRWAEASNPVIVYCVSRKPSGSTQNQNPKPLVLPPPKPELLNRSVNT